MLSTLCNAVARCHCRRLRAAAAAAPLPAALVGVLVVLAPTALVRVGRAVGGALVGAAGDPGVTDGVVLGPLLAASVAGAALALSLPERSAFGQQLAAGPFGDLAVVCASLLVPALVAAFTVVPSLVAVCVGLALELPGGPSSGVALAIATLAGIPAGAVVAEGGLAAARGRPRRALAVTGGALAWFAACLASGGGALGPLAPVGGSLGGSVPGWLAILLGAGTAVVLGLAWVGLAATRPAKRMPGARGGSHRLSPGRALGGGSSRESGLVIPVAVAVLVSRRDDVRLATVGAVGFGTAGIAVARSSGVPTPTGFLLATTTALLGSLLGALAACGILLQGRWLWLGGSRGTAAVTRAACLVGLVGSALPVALVGAFAAVATGVSWGALGFVSALVVLGSAAALAAGGLVPWSGEGVGDQLATFAALATVAIATSLAIGIVAPRLVAAGLPGPAVALLACAALLGAAGTAMWHRLEAGT